MWNNIITDLSDSAADGASGLQDAMLISGTESWISVLAAATITPYRRGGRRYSPLDAEQTKLSEFSR